VRCAYAVETRTRSRKREKQRKKSTIWIQRNRSDVSDNHTDQGVKDSDMFRFFLTDFSVSKCSGAKKNKQGDIEVRHARNRARRLRYAQVTSEARAEFLRTASPSAARVGAVEAVAWKGRFQPSVDHCCNLRA